MIGRDVVRQVQHLMRPLQVRLANSIARAVVQLIDDDKKLQLLQLGVQAGEDVDDAERVQNYGFSSVPLPGAEAVVVFPNGDRAHALVVGVDDRRYRPTGGAPGDAVMYNNLGIEVRITGMEILAGGGASLAFADHVHLDSMGGITSPATANPPPANDGSGAPAIPPFNVSNPPAYPANSPYLAPAGGTVVLKGG